ncbi:hypothetical protein F4859DRAFT_509016 [Xylaria cf. heliscus]|nr:hypothetical protein F4859DRAFT_509016 [Xylaria cf. heliscus]
MGRAKKKNRRSRADGRNSNIPRNNLDRDDDYPMHDVGNNSTPAFTQRRGRRRNNTNNRNNNGQQGRDNRSLNNRNPFDRFTNPFEKLNLDGLAGHDEQGGTRFRGGGNGNGNRNRNRNRGDNQGNGNQNHNAQQHNHHNGPRQRQNRPANAGPATNSNSNSNSNNEGNYNHAQTQNRHNNRNGKQPPRPSSPARLTRFCTECSTVRRANLTLRDWLGSAILRASEVLDSWGDEVGVGRGSADEMDWQPEPVVRVLILAAATTTNGGVGGDPTPAPSTIGGGSGTGEWAPPPPPQQQQQRGGLMMGWGGPGAGGAAAAGAAPWVNANRDTGSWGLQPGALNPGFSSGGTGGSVWEIDEWAPGSTAVFGSTNTSSSWANHPLIVPRAKMISPPETPPFSMTIT